jgi:hypothetical protein
MRSLPLWLEAGRWRRAGRTARLWWRDDDAAGRSSALDRLLQISQAAGVPLTLAVVPAGDMTGLGERLVGLAGVSVVQHGVDHRNRRAGPVAGEFPRDWTLPELEVTVRWGWRQMAPLPRPARVFVPPWNDVHPQLEAALWASHYVGWSAHGTLGRRDGLQRVDVHLDLLRWRGGARFRGTRRILTALAAEMRRRRRAGRWEAPIGLLTHHLVHDAAAWAFLDEFLRWTAGRPELRWVSLPELIGEEDRGAAAGMTERFAAS